MHPHTFHSTLFDHKVRDEVFVIMSFAPEFAQRWQEVIEPTISDDLELTPNRVDYNLSGQSVVHDILDGIAHARLIIADITSMRMSDEHGKAWPQRNGNVMWELGIAHVMRLPDEVIMVRSDDDRSIFDLTQFRAFQYDPSDVPAARDVLLQLARDRLKTVDRSRSDHVRACVDTLHPHALLFLLDEVPETGCPFSIEATAGKALVVPRLFELGILRSATFDLRKTETGATEIDIKYAVTPFGQDVLKAIIRQFGVEP